jgi:hypothetical protein
MAPYHSLQRIAGGLHSLQDGLFGYPLLEPVFDWIIRRMLHSSIVLATRALYLPRARRLRAAKEEGSAKGVGVSPLCERGPVSMAGGDSSVGGADYTPSPNVPSGRQSTRRRSMSTKTVSKQTPLKCLDCKDEFDGLAMHTEHYVESGSVLTTSVFHRALVDCGNGDSYKVVARDA